MSYDFDELKMMLEGAMSELYRDNCFFFEHGVGEWSISSEFHSIMKTKYGECFKGYDMDAEYNLMKKTDCAYAAKVIVDANGKTMYIRPDFIVHKRDSYKRNLLCVELKRKGGKWLKHDYYKLSFLTQMCSSEAGRYVRNYSFGVSVLMLKRRVECRWYKRGEIVETRHASVDVKHNVPFLIWQ